MVKATLLSISLFIGLVGGGSHSLDQTVHPNWVTPPAPLAPGTQGQATLTVDQAGSTDTVVSLSSSNTSQVTVPSSVTVPAGSTSVHFMVTATSSATASATVTGTANSEEASGLVTITNGG